MAVRYRLHEGFAQEQVSLPRMIHLLVLRYHTQRRKAPARRGRRPPGGQARPGGHRCQPRPERGGRALRHHGGPGGSQDPVGAPNTARLGYLFKTNDS